MTTYIEPTDARVLRKIGVNVAVLVCVSFLLIGVVALVT